MRRPAAPRRVLLALFLAALLAPAAAVAEGVGRIFYFGDSLTDCCVIGRRTQGGAPNWADLLPPLIGARHDASVATNRAVAGAQSDHRNIATFFERRAGYPGGFLNQVERFLADGIPVGQGDLAAIWIGTNDIHPSARPAEGADSLRQPLGPRPETARLADFTLSNIRAGVDALHDHGFRSFLLLSPYDLADADMTPEPGSDALATAYSLAIRDRLSTFATAGATTHFLDVLALLDSVQADAERYGFVYVTGEIPCPSGCFVLPRAAQEKFVFVDPIHFTTAFHEVVAEAAAAVLAGRPTPVPARDEGR